MEELRNSKGQTIKEALEGIVYPPCHNLTIAERDWWADVAIFQTVNHETATEANHQLSEEIEKLKKEIVEKREEVLIAGGIYTDFKNMKDERDGLKVRWEELEEENEKLKEQLSVVEDKRDYWEGEHSNLWLGVFGVLNDAGYGPTSTGQLISFIIDIIKENEEFKSQIPDKKGKKLSQNDKAVLRNLRDYLIHVKEDQEKMRKISDE